MNKRFRKILAILILISILLSSLSCACAVSYRIDKKKKYIGVYSQYSNAVSLGADINMIGWFDNLYAGASETYLRLAVDQHRYTPFITLQPYVSPKDKKHPNRKVMKEIARGKYDKMIIRYLKQLSRGNRKNTDIFVRFAHEMEPHAYGKKMKKKVCWYQWQTDDYKSYVRGFRHVVRLGRKYAPNVKWVWAPNRFLKTTNKYYPGNYFVDYIGVTVNTRQLGKIKYPSFFSFFSKTKGKWRMEKYGKPLFLSEVAVTMNNAAARQYYFGTMFDFLATHSRYKGMVVFDFNKPKSKTDPAWHYNFTKNKTLNALFRKKSRNIIYDFILPESVLEIEDRSFLSSRYKNVYISDGTLLIGESAFANSSALQTIRIPASVESIGENAFAGIPNLRIIGMPGSAAESYAAANGILFLREVP